MNKLLYVTLFGMLALTNSLQTMEQLDLDDIEEILERAEHNLRQRPQPQYTIHQPSALLRRAFGRSANPQIKQTSSQRMGWVWGVRN